MGGGTQTVLRTDADSAVSDAIAHVELTGRAQAGAAARARGPEAWVWWIAGADLVAVAAGVAIGLLVRFGVTSVGASGHFPLAVTLIPAWLVVLVSAGAYDPRSILSGSDLYTRVINAAAWLLAAIALSAFALRIDPSRTFVLVMVPATAALTVAARYAVRKSLHRGIARGRSVHRVLAVGSKQAVSDLVAHMSRAAYAGFNVVAALTPGGEVPLPSGVQHLEGDVSSATAQATRLGCDTIAFAGGDLSGRELRRLSWLLEDTNIDLVVAPSLTDVAGPRIRMRPVEGLPLLHIDRPQFTGVRRFAKEGIDRTFGAIALLVASPVMLVVAVAVRLSSRGPVIYRQARVGLRGRQFNLYKFRSMRNLAEQRRYELDQLNDHDGVLFKIRRDPRVTTVGRFLRRFSLDELPQLWNVVRGDMSLVGPRPPLPEEVERYGGDVHRRLLVKPGLTGLWQVSGRSDLSWDETVRLDLHYVDNWSVGLDLVLLLKTLTSVLRGRGAY